MILCWRRALSKHQRLDVCISMPWLKSTTIPELHCHDRQSYVNARQSPLLEKWWSLIFKNEIQMDADVFVSTDGPEIPFTETLTPSLELYSCFAFYEGLCFTSWPWPFLPLSIFIFGPMGPPVFVPLASVTFLSGNDILMGNSTNTILRRYQVNWSIHPSSLLSGKWEKCPHAHKTLLWLSPLDIFTNCTVTISIRSYMSVIKAVIGCSPYYEIIICSIELLFFYTVLSLP